GAPNGQGGVFWGFTTGSLQYGFSITPTLVYMLQSSGFVAVGGTFADNNQLHNYDYQYVSASSQKLYRDGVLIGSTTAGDGVTANRLIFGDGTGGANAHADMASYEFLQGGATPALGTTWGRLKRLYSGR